MEFSPFFKPNFVAGAACVHFHILSSESRKYFQQAIATSGTPYSPFGRAHENNNYNRLMKVAKKENKKVKTLADLENFLLETDEKSLSNLTNTNDFGKSLSTIWGPTIERWHFLLCFALFRNGLVNLMFTFTLLYRR